MSVYSTVNGTYGEFFSVVILFTGLKVEAGVMENDQDEFTLNLAIVIDRSISL